MEVDAETESDGGRTEHEDGDKNDDTDGVAKSEEDNYSSSMKEYLNMANLV
ncbi:hypothetical protein C0995_014391 [Termitomyces sp. Mi166|nr:hypothetical protein C0995_014391 [Termitomyces sp. Mi166\